MYFHTPPTYLSNESEEERRSLDESRGVATATATATSTDHMETEDQAARINNTVTTSHGGEEEEDNYDNGDGDSNGYTNEEDKEQREETANKERRASIQLIMKDPNLTNVQRRHSIQILMDSRRRSSFGASFTEAAKNVTAEFALRSGCSSSSSSSSSKSNSDSSSDSSSDNGSCQSSNGSYCEEDSHSTNSSDGDGNGNGNFNGNTISPRNVVVIPSEETMKGFLSLPTNNSSKDINVAYSSITGEPIGDTKQLEYHRPKCPHYVRHCSIISPCCGMVFGCRLCHDECEDQGMPFMKQIEFSSQRGEQRGREDKDNEEEESKKRKRGKKNESRNEEETPNKISAATTTLPTGDMQGKSICESGSRCTGKIPTEQCYPCSAQNLTNCGRKMSSVAPSSSSGDESNSSRKRSSALNKNRRRNSITSKKKKKFSRRFSLSSVTTNGGDDVHHDIDRFDIKEIICRNCFTRQSSKTNNCINCKIQFGEYHCDICNLWMESKDEPYHCDECGICRVGGRDNYKHCKACGMCIDKTLYETHNCTAGKMMSNCPVCFEDLFSSRTACHELPCNHSIHWRCYLELSTVDIRCPICKKTTVHEKHRHGLWSALREDIEAQPVPPDQTRVVDVLCNDCEFRECDRRWHPLGVECSRCCSYNTAVDFKMAGQEAFDYLAAIKETREGIDMLGVNSIEE